MTHWIIKESSTGNLYEMLTDTDDTEQVYKAFGKQIYNMPDDLDTGNVDIDIFQLQPKIDKVRAIDINIKLTNKPK